MKLGLGREETNISKRIKKNAQKQDERYQFLFFENFNTR